jgi:hypothetical protein
MNNLNTLKTQLAGQGWIVAPISNESGWFAMMYILELSNNENDRMEPSISIYPSSVHEQAVDIKIRYHIGREWMRSEINRMPVIDVIRNLQLICNTLVKQAQASRNIWGSVTFSKVKGEL